MQQELPLPHIAPHNFNGIVVLSDDSLFEASGVRIAFTARAGGDSKGAYASLNLGDHVDDDPASVHANREAVLTALGSSPSRCVFANQVHGDRVVVVAADADDEGVRTAQDDARAEADAVVVARPEVAALLCFADCVPVIIVAPTGAFAVVHAGWRGVMAHIAPKAVRLLSDAVSQSVVTTQPVRALPVAHPSGFNVYIGPHIHRECFETSKEVRDQFVEEFGEIAAADERHVDLSAALRVSLIEAGISAERIFDVGICTKCRSDEYFSYRASDGCCGRHAAIAVKL